MKKDSRKSLRSQTSQLSMKKKQKSNTEIQVLISECSKDLDDSEEIKINPLPTPVFTHLEACNIETPKLNYCPALTSSLFQRASELKWKLSHN